MIAGGRVEIQSQSRLDWALSGAPIPTNTVCSEMIPLIFEAPSAFIYGESIGETLSAFHIVACSQFTQLSDSANFK